MRFAERSYESGVRRKPPELTWYQGKIEFTSLKLGCASLTSLLAAMLLENWQQICENRSA